ncbi:MAG: hypothetical protein M0R74_03580 [Dehalococcoidia bacterium]|nr:hypothetical protein [Dehalococcoidia bacterium]
MHAGSRDIEITIVTRQAPVRPSVPALPQVPWLFAVWMGASAVVAVGAGLVLGILAALESGVGAERWTQAVQAHGRLQLFGFVAVFVVALGFEFAMRLYQRPPFPAAVRAGVPAMLGLGAILQAAGQVWYDSIGFLVLPGSLLSIAGAVAFAVVVLRIPTMRSISIDPQPYYFRAAALWLAAAALLGAWALARTDEGVINLVESHAVAELFLRGFILNIVVAIALRAFVGHLGLELLSSRRQLAIFVALNASTVAWLAGQGLGALPAAIWLARLADITLAGSLLLFTAWFRVLTPLRRGIREPRYEWLVPLAWSAVVVYAVVLAGVAIAGADPSLYQEGAIRHTFLLGFMIPLMIGMAHVVLARFGVGAVPWENALTAGFLLAFLAWPLRVLPVTFSDAPGDIGRAVLATSGFMLMAALVLVAVVSLRTAVLVRRRVAAIMARHTARHAHAH